MKPGQPFPVAWSGSSFRRTAEEEVTAIIEQDVTGVAVL